MFKLESEYKPTGDQPEAINELVKGLEQKTKFQTLKGVTGSGKTFTIANVIEKVNKPTLVLAHNKTLAAQLYAEFKEYFPSNSVEYFVSYYDYYQPEAYLPVSGTYIDKDLSKKLSSSFSVSAIEGMEVKASGMNSDMHASAEYRANLVSLYAKKAVEAC